MTHHAAIAREIALKFEAKLDRLTRNQDGTIKLTLTIHPNEFPAQLMTDPLGQQYMCAMAAVQDDGTPKVSSLATGKPEGRELVSSSPVAGKVPEKWEDMLPAKQAAILCIDFSFHDWLQQKQGYGLNRYGMTVEEAAASWLRDKCGIESRRELNINPTARGNFERIYNSFRAWQKGYGIE